MNLFKQMNSNEAPSTRRIEKPAKVLKRNTRKMRERSPERVGWGGGVSSNERGAPRFKVAFRRQDFPLLKAQKTDYFLRV